jgi:hypothetical protein
MRLYIIIISAFIYSCSKNSTKKEENRSTDTLVYEIPMEEKVIKLVYKFNHNLFRYSNENLRKNQMTIYDNFNFDVKKCNRCEGFNLYLFPYSNRYYIDTLNWNEIILIYVNPSNITIRIKEAFYKYRFEGKLKEIFPNLNYIFYPIEENSEFYLDKTELLTANYTDGKIKFTYSNFKRILYKSDGSVIKILYVKKNIDRNDISKVIRDYKYNNMIERIPN